MQPVISKRVNAGPRDPLPPGAAEAEFAYQKLLVEHGLRSFERERLLRLVVVSENRSRNAGLSDKVTTMSPGSPDGYIKWQEVAHIMKVRSANIAAYVDAFGIGRYRLPNGRVLYCREDVERAAVEVAAKRARRAKYFRRGR